MHEFRKEKKRDPAIGAKVAAAQKGKPKNPTSVAKMKASMNSPETKMKISGVNHWRVRKRLADNPSLF